MVFTPFLQYFLLFLQRFMAKMWQISPKVWQKRGKSVTNNVNINYLPRL